MKINNKYLLAANNILGNDAGGLMINGVVPSEYNGYISSFGAVMVQSGLYPTILAYYVDTKKKKVAELIFEIYLHANKLTISSKFDEYSKQKINDKQFRNEIVQSLIALKLVIRTFKIDKNEDEHE